MGFQRFRLSHEDVFVAARGLPAERVGRGLLPGAGRGPDMSSEACAGLVERGDPDRFMAVMAAPVAVRQLFWPLYAFNLELARAPWVTQEPLIAEMRLQWWRDVVSEIGAGGVVRVHEVASPLARVVRGKSLPVALLDGMAEARRWDIYRAPFADEAAFSAHLDATAGHLMWLCALALGAEVAAEAAVRDVAWALGLANWLRAVPELEARGRLPLVDGRQAAVKALAAEGLARLARARRRGVSRALAPALLPAWQAGGLLAQVVRAPGRVADGTLGLAEFRKRGGLAVRAVFGGW